jgi:hypothetical protein
VSALTGTTTRGLSKVFTLTLPEVQLLRDHLPGLSLPAFVPAAALEDSEDEAASPAVVLAALQSRQLLDDEATLADDDWSKRMPSVLLLALSLQMTGRLVFQVQAWRPGAAGGLLDTLLNNTTVTDTLCAGMTVRASTGADVPEAELTVAPVSGLYPTLAELLPPEPTEHGRPAGTVSTGAASLGLVESRALIAAIRAGDERVVASITADFHAEGARDVLQDLSGAMGTGYRIKAFSSVGAGGALFARDWFRGPRGWLKLSVAVPPPEPGAAAPTAQAVTDEGRVTIRRTDADGIRQDLLGLVAGIIAKSSTEPIGAPDAR